MFKLKTVCLTFLFATAACLQALASPPSLPPSAIGDKTYLVLHVDTSKLEAATLKASATALLGDQSATADTTLTKLKDIHDAVEKAGGQALAAVADLPAEGDQDWPQFIFYVQTKPGADTDAIKKLLTKDMRAEERAKWQFDTADGFLVMHQVGIDVPKQGSASQAKLFADAFKGAGDKTAIVAFVSSDALRKEMQKPNNSPTPNLTKLASLLEGCKFITAAANSGEAPTLEVEAQTADEASAKALVDESTQLIQQLHTFADNMRQQGIPQMQGLVTFADQLKLTQNGAQVSITLDGKGLGPVLTTYLGVTAGQHGGGRHGSAPSSAPAAP